MTKKVSLIEERKCTYLEYYLKVWGTPEALGKTTLPAHSWELVYKDPIWDPHNPGNAAKQYDNRNQVFIKLRFVIFHTKFLILQEFG